MRRLLAILLATCSAAVCLHCDRAAAADADPVADAYCLGWADAHGVYLHETPSDERGFQCVTDAYSSCEHSFTVRGRAYCAYPVLWSEVGR